MLENTTKEATSSLTGNYSIIKVLSKEFNMIVSAPGFETKEMVIKIIRGKVIKLDIAL